MRIIAHTCSNTEIVCALGRADWLVGIDDHSDHPPEVVAGLPRIGPDLDIDVERILELKPDLVLTSLTVPGHERCLERIRATGVPYIVTRPQSLAEVAADIIRIGTALDAAAVAARIAKDFEQALLQRPSDVPIPVLIEWWPKPVIVPAHDSWVNEMLELAGAFNPFATRHGESIQIGTDDVKAAAPQAIVMSWCGVDASKYRSHVVARRAGWESVPAIRQNRIFAVSEGWLGRPGPRLLEGIERLRRIVAQCRSAAA